MKFLDRIFKGKAVDDRQEARQVCELRLAGEAYLADEFDFLYDSIDGEMQFRINVVISETTGKGFEQLICKGEGQIEGDIRFYRNTDMPDEGNLFRIHFSEGVCSNFRRCMRDDREITDLVIVPKHVSLDGEECKID